VAIPYAYWQRGNGPRFPRGTGQQVMSFSKVAAHQGHGDGIASGQVLQLTDEISR
jgi:hypothetical protein